MIVNLWVAPHQEPKEKLEKIDQQHKKKRNTETRKWKFREFCYVKILCAWINQSKKRVFQSAHSSIQFSLSFHSVQTFSSSSFFFCCSVRLLLGAASDAISCVLYVSVLIFFFSSSFPFYENFYLIREWSPKKYE